jgi:aryl-alcohol dehydrogenase-like predicted oxidoreductase
MPLLQGILTGKYRPRGPDLPSRVKIVMRVMQLDLFRESHERPSLLRRLFSKPYPMRREALEPLFEVMANLAKQHNATIAQVALNWLLGINDRVLPIVGAKNLRQAQDNARTLSWQLSQGEMDLISATEATIRRQALGS